MTVLIFANGELTDTDWIRPRLEQATSIIAADGGIRHLLAVDLWPDVLIGDMDSLPTEVEGLLPETDTEVVTFSHDKNETDLELALLYAAEHFQGPIEIYGAIGGRLDQTLANILLLAHPALEDRSVHLVQPNEEVWLVVDRTEIAGEPGDIVSLIPLQGDVEIKDTSGLRWPLHNETLIFGRARGVSNEMVGNYGDCRADQR
ncbi:MAG: thiamine diphosphokinase [Chloroflexota bacterium]